MLPIVEGRHHPILRALCPVITTITPQMRGLCKAMMATMQSADGVGIAAPQVGHNLRIIITTQRTKKNKQLVLKGQKTMINPLITHHNEKIVIEEEGCLSLPGIRGLVPRRSEITVQYQDVYAHHHTATLKGLDARIVQHEIDHLDGILFIDRATTVYPYSPH